jgi:hypothetical protein
VIFPTSSIAGEDATRTLTHIQLSSINSESTKDAKVILVRCHKDRWQACCHFEEEKGSVDTTLDNSVTNQRSAPQASVYSMHDQPPNSAASMAPEDHDSSANAVNNTSALTDSTIEKLINTIERLVTGVEDLTLAVEDRRKPEESACVAINKLTASLDKTPRDAQADGQSDFDGVTDHHDSKASTEYDLGINTPSTVQDVGETNWISDSSDHDEDSATVLRSMPRTTVSAFDAYVAWARTQENCVVFDLAPRGSNFSSQRVDDGASLRDLHPKPPLQQVKDT